jgi:hypothetical protein
MYFITVDVDGYLTGMYDGSKDYIHRVTGEPIKDARPLPDGSIPIGDTCITKIRTAYPLHVAKWDGTCVVHEPQSDLAILQEELLSLRTTTYMESQKDAISGMSAEQIRTELGG